MTLLTLVVVGKDADALAHFELDPWADAFVHKIENDHGVALSSIGNAFLENAMAPVIGLCHADAAFGPGALEAFTRAALAGAVCGIVGVDMEPMHRWCDVNPGPVSTLDSCSVFMRREMGLRFDSKTFNGFHCHVEDLCLQAQSHGIPVIVPPACASHRGVTGNGEAWLAEYWRYRAILGEKWSGMEFRTT